MNSFAPDMSLSVREKPAFTVALPVFNEAEILPELHRRLTDACETQGVPYEILFVDDGSVDATPSILAGLRAQDPNTSVVTLSRNFGQPSALAAAVDFASGDTLILMDADMQDDPAVVPDLLRKQHEEEADVVYVVRTDRKEGLIMRSLYGLFHKLISHSTTYPMPRDAGPFGLVGPKALAEIRSMPERLRFFPGIRAFVGFKQVPLVVERQPRYDGSSRMGYKGLISLAALAFFSQSRIPVLIFYFLSGISLMVALILTVFALSSKALGIAVVSWASTIIALAFFSSIIILGQALICEFMARIYEEVRRRPTYIVAKVQRSLSPTKVGVSNESS